MSNEEKMKLIILGSQLGKDYPGRKKGEAIRRAVEDGLIDTELGLELALSYEYLG